MVKLIKLDHSPPARAAMMTCEALNLSVEMVDKEIIVTDEESKLERQLMKVQIDSLL